MYAIEVETPSVATVNFTVSITVGGQFVTLTTLEVFGVPTNESRLSCAAVHSPPGFVHVLENVTCTIVVEDMYGPTAGLPAEFNITTNYDVANVTSTLTTSDHGYSYTFVVMSPFSSSPEFHIGALLPDGLAINGSEVNLTVICLLSCFFMRARFMLIVCSCVLVELCVSMHGHECMCVVCDRLQRHQLPGQFVLRILYCCLVL